ncbi:hypothetical protein B0H17DRAFT_1146184 [Mycena rosella]|uniref:Uncharacterized protein n=1 Tax=Mycena rosella TaxID=1033263 RepID=A0AAD7CQ71_MYCRO|nr:hypothetical protein B0H17DRAFT_1146184 [Mycena rosella]
MNDGGVNRGAGNNGVNDGTTGGEEDANENEGDRRGDRCARPMSRRPRGFKDGVGVVLVMRAAETEGDAGGVGEDVSEDAGHHALGQLRIAPEVDGAEEDLVRERGLRRLSWSGGCTGILRRRWRRRRRRSGRGSPGILRRCRRHRGGQRSLRSGRRSGREWGDGGADLEWQRSNGRDGGKLERGGYGNDRASGPSVLTNIPGVVDVVVAGAAAGTMAAARGEIGRDELLSALPHARIFWLTSVGLGRRNVLEGGHASVEALERLLGDGTVRAVLGTRVDQVVDGAVVAVDNIVQLVDVLLHMGGPWCSELPAQTMSREGDTKAVTRYYPPRLNRIDMGLCGTVVAYGKARWELRAGRKAENFEERVCRGGCLLGGLEGRGRGRGRRWGWRGFFLALAGRDEWESAVAVEEAVELVVEVGISRIQTGISPVLPLYIRTTQGTQPLPTYVRVRNNRPRSYTPPPEHACRCQAHPIRNRAAAPAPLFTRHPVARHPARAPFSCASRTSNQRRGTPTLILRIHLVAPPRSPHHPRTSRRAPPHANTVSSLHAERPRPAHNAIKEKEHDAHPIPSLSFAACSRALEVGDEEELGGCGGCRAQIYERRRRAGGGRSRGGEAQYGGTVQNSGRGWVRRRERAGGDNVRGLGGAGIGVGGRGRRRPERTRGGDEAVDGMRGEDSEARRGMGGGGRGHGGSEDPEDWKIWKIGRGRGDGVGGWSKGAKTRRDEAAQQEWREEHRQAGCGAGCTETQRTTWKEMEMARMGKEMDGIPPHLRRDDRLAFKCECAHDAVQAERREAHAAQEDLDLQASVSEWAEGAKEEDMGRKKDDCREEARDTADCGKQDAHARVAEAWRKKEGGLTSGTRMLPALSTRSHKGNKVRLELVHRAAEDAWASIRNSDDRRRGDRTRVSASVRVGPFGHLERVNVAEQFGGARGRHGGRLKRSDKGRVPLGYGCAVTVDRGHKSRVRHQRANEEGCRLWMDTRWTVRSGHMSMPVARRRMPSKTGADALPPRVQAHLPLGVLATYSAFRGGGAVECRQGCMPEWGEGGTAELLSAGRGPRHPGRARMEHHEPEVGCGVGE